MLLSTAGILARKPGCCKNRWRTQRYSGSVRPRSVV